MFDGSEIAAQRSSYEYGDDDDDECAEWSASSTAFHDTPLPATQNRKAQNRLTGMQLRAD